MADGSAYRVAFLDAATAAVEPVARITGGRRHPSALDPFVSRLLQQGRRGMVDLIDEATGICIARRQVWPSGPRCGSAQVTGASRLPCLGSRRVNVRRRDRQRVARAPTFPTPLARASMAGRRCCRLPGDERRGRERHSQVTGESGRRTASTVPPTPS
jgi:hypothetical protein